MKSENTWTSEFECPFCGGELDSLGSDFIDHVDENPDCEGAFEEWRDAVADDMRAGWPG